eukprot:442096-Pelagomonas_calceolata.AAC.2
MGLALLSPLLQYATYLRASDDLPISNDPRAPAKLRASLGQKAPANVQDTSPRVAFRVYKKGLRVLLMLLEGNICCCSTCPAIHGLHNCLAPHMVELAWHSCGMPRP